MLQVAKMMSLPNMDRLSAVNFNASVLRLENIEHSLRFLSELIFIIIGQEVNC